MCTLAKGEWITLISCIAASISAIFAAISAWLIWRQNATKIKIKITNSITTKTPQNIFNSDSDFAVVRVDLQNLSSHNVTFSDCTILIEGTSYEALEKNMHFDFHKIVDIYSENGAHKELKSLDQYLTFPHTVIPYNFERSFILFPKFIHTADNLIKGKIEFAYNSKKRRRKILLHKVSFVDN